MRDPNDWSQVDPQPAWAPGLPMRVDAVRRDGWAYTTDLGQRIADSLSAGVSLPEQHVEAPSEVPPPTVIRAWRVKYPAFGIMLRHAEAVRADLLVEQAVVIADTSPLPAPRVALQVSTRLAMAERLERVSGSGRHAEAGSGGVAGRLGSDPQPIAPDLSDDDLLRLAAAGQVGEGVEVGG